MATIYSTILPVSVVSMPALTISAMPVVTIAAMPAIVISSVPPPVSNTAAITVSGVITTTSVKIIDANPNRKGLILYNNSANSVYMAFGSAANSNTNMTVILATFATWVMPQPIYTGAIYGIRNSGTGTVLATELT